jgi:hypothetical protein
MLARRPRLVPPQILPQRLKRRRLPRSVKAVTMAAGFVCRDGLAIAADRQFTSLTVGIPTKNASYVNCDGITVWQFGDTQVRQT